MTEFRFVVRLPDCPPMFTRTRTRTRLQRLLRSDSDPRPRVYLKIFKPRRILVVKFPWSLKSTPRPFSFRWKSEFFHGLEQLPGNFRRRRPLSSPKEYVPRYLSLRLCVDFPAVSKSKDRASLVFIFNGYRGQRTSRFRVEDGHRVPR